jgi:hypothetical protein
MKTQCKIQFVRVPGRFAAYPGSDHEWTVQKLVCSTHQWDFSNAVTAEAGPIPDQCPIGEVEARIDRRLEQIEAVLRRPETPAPEGMCPGSTDGQHQWGMYSVGTDGRMIPPGARGVAYSGVGCFCEKCHMKQPPQVLL